MTIQRSICFLIFVVVLSPLCTPAQHPATEENAALRYWSAFSVMQDSAVTNQQARKLMAILNGTDTYNDSEFAALVEKNKLPLEIMARAGKLPKCDWGLDYSFGGDEPVEYVRDASTLGRLNVLYAFHLISAGNTNSAVDTLAAGLRFSHDVSNGGTLFATVVADALISEHLRAVSSIMRASPLSAAQRSTLLAAIAPLGPDGLDWQSAINREFLVLRGHLADDAQASAASTRLSAAYAQALRDPSALSALQDAIHNAPATLTQLVPDPSRVLEDKRALIALLAQTRASLQ